MRRSSSTKSDVPTATLNLCSPKTPIGAIVLLMSFGSLATVSAQLPPLNDNFINAIQLSGTNIFTAGSNDNATKELGEPLHADNIGGKSIWWSWQAPDTGYVTMSTKGSLSSSSFGGVLDTVLGVYVGSSVTGLTEIGSNDDGPEDLTSELRFKAIAGTKYWIAVDGFNFDNVSTDADSGAVFFSLKFSSGLPVAPAWNLPSTDNSIIYSTNYLGKVVVLNFWATWCAPCIAEIPDLTDLQQKYGADGLIVIGISVDQSEDGIHPPAALVQSFATSHHLNYPVVMTRPNNVNVETVYGGIPYIPNTFIINRQNQIEQTFVGTQDFKTFEQSVVPLLYANLALTAALSNGQLHVSWPITKAAFRLEETSNLVNGVWSPVQQSIKSDGTNRYVDLPATATARFLRLRSQ